MERKRDIEHVSKRTLPYDIKFEHQSLVQMISSNIQSGNAGRRSGVKGGGKESYWE